MDKAVPIFNNRTHDMDSSSERPRHHFDDTIGVGESLDGIVRVTRQQGQNSGVNQNMFRAPKSLLMCWYGFSSR